VFGSQVLETAIGLALIFWVLASAASALAEGFSRLLQKRSRDLEATLVAMMVGPPAGTTSDADAAPADKKPTQNALDALKGTSMYAPAYAAARRAHTGTNMGKARARPTYLSARAFADMVFELSTDGRLAHLPGLQKRLEALIATGQTDTLALKAGLESWFDETMGRVQDAYKRWVTIILFAIGLLIAGFGNVSTIAVAQSLWTQPVTRQVVVDQAGSLLKPAPTTTTTGANGTSPTVQVPTLQGVEGLGLPIGWSKTPGPSDIIRSLAGFVLTALLVMLGAPFWFDALSRLVSLRTTGAKPPPAPADPSSATARRAKGLTASQDAPLPFVVTLQQGMDSRSADVGKDARIPPARQ
jgi:hypothetical protein